MAAKSVAPLTTALSQLTLGDSETPEEGTGDPPTDQQLVADSS